MLSHATLSRLAGEEEIPGISVAISKSGQSLVTETVGLQRRGTPTHVTKSTLFEAASLSKVAFAYIVLKMAERGEINLYAPLHTLTKSGFGPLSLRNTEEYHTLTARMILSHQAGLPNWFTSDTDKRYIQSPGTGFNYSGVAFCFLSEVIEEISGQPLEELAQAEFQRLGMNNSSFFQPEDATLAQANLATGHDTKGVPDSKSHYPKQSEINIFSQPHHANPAASLFTTAEEFTKLLKACVDDDYIRVNMFNPAISLASNDQKAVQSGVTDKALKKISWGLGIGLQACDDGTVVAFQWGDSETFTNFAAVHLNHDGSYQAVTCLTNSANGSKVFRQVVEPIVGDLTPTFEWLSHRERLEIKNTPVKPHRVRSTPIPPESTTKMASIQGDVSDDSTQTASNRKKDDSSFKP